MKKKADGKFIVDWIMRAGLFLLAVILPLYHRDGFVMIGDRKYTFFLIVSVALACVLVVSEVLSLIQGEYEIVPLEKVVLIYGFAIMISAYRSRYPQTALWGYQDWNMGLVSQLLFMVIFAATLRTKKIQDLILPWMLRSAMVVFVLGVVNRFSIDPLGMFAGLEDWNRTHLISTIGNMNWYSGYMTFMFAIGYVLYLKEGLSEEADVTGGTQNRNRSHKSTWFQIGKVELILFVIIGFATILTQGSESGLLACGILFFLGLLYAVLKKEVELVGRIQDSLIILSVTGLGLSFISVGLPQSCNFAEDALTYHLMKPQLWLLLLALFVLFGILYRWFLRKQKALLVSYGILTIALGSFLAVVWNLRILLEEWGSGRIELWKVSWEAYCQMPFMNQLIGVGPDCYAHYMYEYFPAQMSTILSGWWGDAVIANAHNEWINRLICTGALGYVTYVGMVIYAIVLFYRNRKKSNYLLPIAAGLIIVMIHQTAGFQHVMVTPFIFLSMGMGANACENK